MNTNQTNGSPFEDAANQSGQDSTDKLQPQHVSSREQVEEVSAETEPPKVSQQDTATVSDYAKHSVEGVSSIQKLVHAMESTGSGFVEEVIDMEPRERGAVEFRVTCPGAPVRRLRLTGNRYTFGSAEGCSIRLSDDTLRPMHAVLLRDASRVIVRAYSVPVQVNASRTTEANLRVGDVLRLGQYQFELLSMKPASVKSDGREFGGRNTELHPGDDRGAANASDSFARSNNAARDPRKSRYSRSGSEDASLGGHSAEDMLWRDRLRREVDQWRERQIECDRREGRIDERESELRNRESELWSRAESLYRREARLQSQETSNFQLYDEFSQRQQELLALREESHLREESFHAREVELREQELQYQSQLAEATRRLQQSQQQAESAAESVAQMREQFESLNAQIEQLSKQHLEIELREQNQRVEHARLRADLEQARDEAVQEHAASETRRLAAEEQAARLEEQIAQMRSAHGSTESEQLSRLSESEAAAESLRQQVEELQQMVSDARNEAEVLRADYEQACSSVRELENIVSESEGRGDENREQWIAETSELRSAVEKLSAEMDQANSELNQLREANEDLTRRLTEAKQDRDQARQDVESRPSHEEFESLRQQLESANERIGNMQIDHEQTLVRLEAAEQQNILRQTATEPSPNQADAVWGEVGHATPETAVADSVDQDSDEPSEPANASAPVTETTDPDSQDVDLMQKHLEDEMRVDGELPDGDQMVGGSLASKLIQDLAADDSFSATSSAEHESALDAFSNLTYSGDEDSGLSTTGYMNPESGDWETDVEGGSEDFSSYTEEVGDQSSSVGSDPAGGLYGNNDEVDGFESEDASYYESEQDSDLSRISEAETALEDEAGAGNDNVMHRESSYDQPDGEETDADSELTDSQFNDSSDEDDTIEAYMNRLLKHVRGNAGDTNTETDSLEDNSEEEELEPLDPNAPLVPKSLAPERDTDLNAMRELANTSARVAIKRSARLQARNIQLKGVIRLVYAMGAVACGAVCFMFLTGALTYVASAMTGLVAIIYIREAMQLFQEASYQYNAATSALQDEDYAGAADDEYVDE